ncbi:hypothetical protein JZ751_018197 [Albula glossodonta]|uniref:Ubiquitin carboxyl-terminal hydrolase n=1 Tax=Albula glossodonta TaxID=121402 RepID=A0A8T2NRS7_9TELE|nr:hypothetical protein JZ751_018197 [Albula glossodonta]
MGDIKAIERVKAATDSYRDNEPSALKTADGMFSDIPLSRESKFVNHIASEGLPSGSDLSPAGESRSFDSLDSSSNLNSGPSSDLNSEGLESKVLVIAPQSDDYGVDGAIALCMKDRGAGQSMYHIKWIKWKDEKTPIITQNENGPCPLLAIMNLGQLTDPVVLRPNHKLRRGDYILDAKPKEISEAQRLNYEQVGHQDFVLQSAVAFSMEGEYKCPLEAEGANVAIPDVQRPY